MKKQVFSIIVFAIAVLAGCEKQTASHSVLDFAKDETLRMQVISNCAKEPNTFMERPECVNANIAGNKKKYDSKLQKCYGNHGQDWGEVDTQCVDVWWQGLANK